ncbi:MAG: phage terminase Nu1 subunit (DNA packaging protein) [Halieaceae bacterium]|jgi:phage terminase Nu1 subunit (DNA packaging protein)
MEVVVLSSTDIDPLWLNKRDAAASVGISTQAFSKWGVKPVQRSGREVFFTVRDIVDNRVERALKGANGETPGELENLGRKKYLEDYRLAKARRIAQEQKNDLAAGTMIPTDFATFALSKIAARIASILDTLPLTMRRAHPDLESRHIDSFTREVAKARNVAAEVDEILPELVEEYAALTNESS